MTPETFRITVVCLGNICRSPMGEVVLQERVATAGLADVVRVDSAGTGDWHLGHPADPRAHAALVDAGYEVEHVSRQITPDWMSDIDLLLAMDEANYRDLAVMLDATGLPSDTRSPLRMFRSFDPALAHLTEPHPDLSVPDPYYGGQDGFLATLDMIEKAADGIVDGLLAQFSVRE